MHESDRFFFFVFSKCARSSTQRGGTDQRTNQLEERRRRRMKSQSIELSSPREALPDPHPKTLSLTTHSDPRTRFVSASRRSDLERPASGLMKLWKLRRGRILLIVIFRSQSIQIIPRKSKASSKREESSESASIVHLIATEQLHDPRSMYVNPEHVKA